MVVASHFVWSEFMCSYNTPDTAERGASRVEHAIITDKQRRHLHARFKSVSV